MKTILKLLIATASISLLACEKDWLDQKRDIQLIVPTTLADLRLLLNSTPVLSYDGVGISEVAAGDIFVTTGTWKGLTQDERNAYIWSDVFKGSLAVSEWDMSYKQIGLCNVVLETVNKIQSTSGNLTEWRDIKGGALFFRAKAFYNLSEIFAPPYNAANLNKPGVHLRLSSDLNETVTRASVEQTYQRIISDLKQASGLVVTTAKFKTDASKPAVLALLSRCYLSMGDYQNAGLYADSSLMLQNTLIDYNSLDQTAAYPFKMFNDEVIFHSALSGNYGIFYAPKGKIDQDLFSQYASGDLRKKLFFAANSDSTQNFKGFYFGIATAFSGLATDELYLIKAECLARKQKLDESMATLNSLLSKRYKSKTFVPLSASNFHDALKLILTERRKQLLLRGVRWSDLRRLNTEQQFADTIMRNIDGVTYKLLPNALKYTFPLPDYVTRDYKIESNPGWQ